jgi:hypothetical protein
LLAKLTFVEVTARLSGILTIRQGRVTSPSRSQPI